MKFSSHYWWKAKGKTRRSSIFAIGTNLPQVKNDFAFNVCCLLRHFYMSPFTAYRTAYVADHILIHRNLYSPKHIHIYKFGVPVRIFFRPRWLIYELPFFSHVLWPDKKYQRAAKTTITRQAIIFIVTPFLFVCFLWEWGEQCGCVSSHHWVDINSHLSYAILLYVLWHATHTQAHTHTHAERSSTYVGAFRTKEAIKCASHSVRFLHYHLHAHWQILKSRLPFTCKWWILSLKGFRICL